MMFLFLSISVNVLSVNLTRTQLRNMTLLNAHTPKKKCEKNNIEKRKTKKSFY